MLTVAYVGNKATGLPRALNLNQIEVRENGFLAGFLAAQRNLSANGDPLRGEATGVFGQIWNVMSAADRSGQVATLRDGIVAGLANFVDQTRGGSFRRQRLMMRCSSGGVPPLNSRSGLGSSRRMAATVKADESLRKGW